MRERHDYQQGQDPAVHGVAPRGLGECESSLVSERGGCGGEKGREDAGGV